MLLKPQLTQVFNENELKPRKCSPYKDLCQSSESMAICYKTWNNCNYFMPKSKNGFEGFYF